MEGKKRRGERRKRHTLIDIQPIRTIIAPEPLKRTIPHISLCAHPARERLDHQHLRALIRIHIPHRHILDPCRLPRSRDIRRQRPNAHPARMITVRVFNQHVRTRRLDAHALVPVRDFEVVDVAIGRADEIDAVRAAHIRATDREVVGFEIGDAVEDEMEGRRVDEDEVVDREIRHGDEAQQARVLRAFGLPGQVALAVDGALVVARVDFDVVAILNHECVAVEGAVFR